MNKFQYLIIIAGLFQLLSQALDQYVIQKEQVIRNMENKIERNDFKKTEIVNALEAYYETYVKMETDSSLRLKVSNKYVIDGILKKDLLRNKNIILDQFKIILSNPYFDVEDEKKYLKYFDEIDRLLDNQEKIQTKKDDLLHNFRYTGLILNDLHAVTEEINDTVKNLKLELKEIVEKKFTILVLGLVSNVLSIFFLLTFFYYIYHSRKKFFL
mgnify:FL=1